MAESKWSNRWSGCLLNAPALLVDTAMAVAGALDTLAMPLPTTATDLPTDLSEVLDRCSGRPHEQNLVALAAIALAEAHRLGRTPRDACPGALALIERVFKKADQLPARTRSLVGQVRDDVAFDEGRAAFVAKVRRCLRRSDRTRFDRVDVDRERRLRLGGALLTYDYAEGSENGRIKRVRKTFNTRNAEGRLFLSIAAGLRVPEPSQSVLSRVRRAVREASKDTVRLVTTSGEARFDCTLNLTARAAAWARRVSTKSSVGPCRAVRPSR